MMERKKHKIDASKQSIGRIASEAALILRGKDRPEYQPHIDEGGIVEVFNIKEVKFTGKKLDQKTYYSYSGYPGGLKESKLKDVVATDAGEVLRRAVREMLPPTKLRTGMLKRLIIK